MTPEVLSRCYFQACRIQSSGRKVSEYCSCGKAHSGMPFHVWIIELERSSCLADQILRDVRKYYSLKYLALSEVTVLIFLAPFMTAILGVVTLGERIGVGQGLAGFDKEDPVLDADPSFHSIAIG
ncbi:hypothetical protein IW262DRAFT_1485298 [Armillaria fumosa]|nr:hypothetical protein IW262DRAFT_1485298 [Armillaria fumosa]